MIPWESTSSISPLFSSFFNTIASYMIFFIFILLFGCHFHSGRLYRTCNCRKARKNASTSDNLCKWAKSFNWLKPTAYFITYQILFPRIIDSAERNFNVLRQRSTIHMCNAHSVQLVWTFWNWDQTFMQYAVGLGQGIFEPAQPHFCSEIHTVFCTLEFTLVHSSHIYEGP